MPEPAFTDTWFDIGDGYEFAARLDQEPGQRAIACYGRDGWDAGDWPLVVIGWQNAATDGPPGGRGPARYALVVRVEGDCERRWFTSEEDRAAATDAIVEYYWRARPDRYGDEIADAVAGYPRGGLPERFYGPFSWARLDRERRSDAQS